MVGRPGLARRRSCPLKHCPSSANLVFPDVTGWADAGCGLDFAEERRLTQYRVIVIVEDMSCRLFDRPAIALLALATPLVPILRAQNVNGMIVGAVLDPAGAALTGARLKLVLAERDLSRET